MKNLKSLIKNFADQTLHGHKLSTSKIYTRFLVDFDQFQQSEAGPEDGWQHLQQERLVLAWLRHQSTRVGEKTLGLRLRVLRDFLAYLKTRDLITCNVIDLLYRRYPLKPKFLH